VTTCQENRVNEKPAFKRARRDIGRLPTKIVLCARLNFPSCPTPRVLLARLLPTPSISTTPMRIRAEGEEKMGREGMGIGEFSRRTQKVAFFLSPEVRPGSGIRAACDLLFPFSQEMANQTNIVIICVSVGVAVGILISSCAFITIRLYRRSRNRQYVDDLSTSSLPVQMNGVDACIDSSASTSNSETPHALPPVAKRNMHWSKHRNQVKDIFASTSGIPRYAYRDIQKATNDFTTVLGHGSFGPVYKARMSSGEVVAVKVLAADSRQGEKEFQTEVLLLSRLHHRHLVNLVAYCADKGQFMLVYEFMSNGSLASLLYGPRSLSWEERLQIALDISHGIEYLHEGAVPPVVHRDLKSANILLDRLMRAKVADFGLSKEEVFDGRKSSLKGTFGYMDPDYVSTSKVTKKSDIYSFGIIIFELVTAINPQQGLMEYINLAVAGGDDKADWEEILDKNLVGKCNLEEVKLLADIGYKCLHKIPRKRPLISEVTQSISRIKEWPISKENSMICQAGDASGLLERIEVQQIMLSRIASRVDCSSPEKVACT
ncbi:hypothetical protein Taro_047602, partial [Colocasia esculenta]|nr:hypothetical protein [Colocasia esculenta]